MAGVSGRKLDETYKLAWLRGLKTTYYLRTPGAPQAMHDSEPSAQFCGIDDLDCEACQ
jgi:ribonucleoside-diphosphate reductase alpha chain